MFCYCFGTVKHLMNRSDDKLTANFGSGGYSRARAPKIYGHFEIEEVYHVRCKSSLLICTKILLQYYYDITNH